LWYPHRHWKYCLDKWIMLVCVCMRTRVYFRSEYTVCAHVCMCVCVCVCVHSSNCKKGTVFLSIEDIMW
jgi:hypothetical protein